MRVDFPRVHYYDQDFVNIYDKTWIWIKDFWHKGNNTNNLKPQYFNFPGNTTINQFDICMASFFLVYSNKNYPVTLQNDHFYRRQEEDGAIRSDYSVETGEPVFSPDNPQGVNPPLFSWTEYNFYHKVEGKKRILEVLPVLQRYYDWLERNFKDEETGLYSVPLVATKMYNSPREEAHYPIDFNAQQALNALYMAALGDILNDKEISFHFKRLYFSLKTRINSLMWDPDDGFYYDLDKNCERIKTATIASYWTLLAEIPNEDRTDRMISRLMDPRWFGTDNPFPTLAVKDSRFSRNGKAYCGSVSPPFTFMVIKGLEKYSRYDFARECTIKHIYHILETYHPDSNKKGALWEFYAPLKEEPSRWPGKENMNREFYITYTALSTIALMIENIVGLYISLPRKTVDWTVPTLELMGIENLALKRNLITITSNKSGRGWEIRLESEKLYYFTVDILGRTKKTLPIPSGKCSMLIDKL